MKKINYLIILFVLSFSFFQLKAKDIITMHNSYRLDCDFNGSFVYNDIIHLYGSNGSIVTSNDKGETWSQKYAGIQENILKLIEINNSFIGLSDGNRLLKSNRKLNNWEIIDYSTLNLELIENDTITDFEYQNSKYLILTKKGNLYQSDNTIDWTFTKSFDFEYENNNNKFKIIDNNFFIFNENSKLFYNNLNLSENWEELDYKKDECGLCKLRNFIKYENKLYLLNNYEIIIFDLETKESKSISKLPYKSTYLFNKNSDIYLISQKLEGGLNLNKIVNDDRLESINNEKEKYNIKYELRLLSQINLNNNIIFFGKDKSIVNYNFNNNKLNIQSFLPPKLDKDNTKYYFNMDYSDIYHYLNFDSYNTTDKGVTWLPLLKDSLINYDVHSNNLNIWSDKMFKTEDELFICHPRKKEFSNDESHFILRFNNSNNFVDTVFRTNVKPVLVKKHNNKYYILESGLSIGGQFTKINVFDINFIRTDEIVIYKYLFNELKIVDNHFEGLCDIKYYKRDSNNKSIYLEEFGYVKSLDFTDSINEVIMFNNSKTYRNRIYSSGKYKDDFYFICLDNQLVTLKVPISSNTSYAETKYKKFLTYDSKKNELKTIYYDSLYNFQAVKLEENNFYLWDPYRIFKSNLNEFDIKFVDSTISILNSSLIPLYRIKQFENLKDFNFTAFNVKSTSHYIFKTIEPDFISSVETTEDIEIPTFLFTNTYPNPARDEVNVSFHYDQRYNLEIATVSVFDIYGKEIIGLEPIFNSKSSYQAEIKLNTQSMPSGIYIINLKFGNTSKAVKFNVIK